jgi:hypothetical protein
MHTMPNLGELLWRLGQGRSRIPWCRIGKSPSYAGDQ